MNSDEERYLALAAYCRNQALSLGGPKAAHWHKLADEYVLLAQGLAPPPQASEFGAVMQRQREHQSKPNER